VVTYNSELKENSLFVLAGKQRNALFLLLSCQLKRTIIRLIVVERREARSNNNNNNKR